VDRRPVVAVELGEPSHASLRQARMAMLLLYYTTLHHTAINVDACL
jgi:hypothetical protein